MSNSPLVTTTPIGQPFTMMVSFPATICQVEIVASNLPKPNSSTRVYPAYPDDGDLASDPGTVTEPSQHDDSDNNTLAPISSSRLFSTAST